LRVLRETAVAPLERAALAFATSAPDSDALVLSARKLRAPFLRAARDAGAHVVALRPLYDRPFRGDGPIESTELGKLAASMARSARVRLAPGALGALLARTGNRLGAVAAALEKLRSVAADREVAAADVAAHVPRSTPGSPWTLAEAILAGD